MIACSSRTHINSDYKLWTKLHYFSSPRSAVRFTELSSVL